MSYLLQQLWSATEAYMLFSYMETLSHTGMVVLIILSSQFTLYELYMITD